MISQLQRSMKVRDPLGRRRRPRATRLLSS